MKFSGYECIFACGLKVVIFPLNQIIQEIGECIFNPQYGRGK